MTNGEGQRAARALPTWVRERLYPMPPMSLRRKPLPAWTQAERDAFEPAGMVWNRDRQEWIVG